MRKAKPARYEFYVNHNRRRVDEAQGFTFREEHLDGPKNISTARSAARIGR